jgi:hypothetical protein
MNEINYRNANLADHCGNCRHLLWDEDVCQCENPAMITDAEIKDELCKVYNAFGGTNTAVTASELAESVRDDHCANESQYNCVCKLWGAKPPYDMAITPAENRQRVADLEAADWQAFVDRVAKIMEECK